MKNQIVKLLVIIVFSLLLYCCGGGGGGGGSGGSVTVVTDDGVNTVTADAGANQSGSVGITVTLQGSGTTDTQDPLIYSWELNSTPLGSTAALANADTATPTFYVDRPGKYIAQLIVTSGSTSSAPDTVLVQAFAPVANAGENQLVSTGVELTLDGSGSSYAGTEILNYHWQILSQPAKSVSLIINDDVESPTFTPMADGQYEIQLTVDNGVLDIDGNLISDTDTVVIVATTIPVADAGLDSTVSTGSTVILNGGGSRTSNGASLSYQWSMIDKPPTSLAVLSDASSVSPSFVADVQGSYVFNLVVNNGIENSSADKVTITVAPPVADAGPDLNISTLETITLDASNSYDASNATLSYNWSVFSAPTGSTATLSDNTIVNPVFTPDVDGEYIIRLVVNNGNEDSLQDIMLITASSPVAAAGSDVHVARGTTVNLNGNGSSDANAYTLTYNWTMISQPAGSITNLSNSDTQTPSFIADVDGNYEISLVVNNGFIDSATDSIIVNATTAPVANAGTDQSVSVMETVTLDGSNSSDTNNASLIYVWTILSAPTGSSASLSQITTVNPEFTPDVKGVYVVSLVVNNGIENSFEDTVSITASIPIADAGANFNPALGAPYVLDGRASEDLNGNSLTYNWSIVSSPIGSIVDLSDPTSATPSLTFDTEGTCEIELVVNNGFVDSLVDTVTINAKTSIGGVGLFSDDFETGMAPTWSASNGVWEVGAPTSGPGIAYIGSSVLATILDGLYTGSSRLESMEIQLPTVAVGEGINLSFWHWFSIYAGNRATSPYGCSSGQDYGSVEIKEETSPSVWSDWTALDSGYYTGSSGSWSYVNFDLTSYAGKNIKISFKFVNNATTYGSCSGLAAGWYIDEVLVDISTLP